MNEEQETEEVQPVDSTSMADFVAQHRARRGSK